MVGGGGGGGEIGKTCKLITDKRLQDLGRCVFIFYPSVTVFRPSSAGFETESGFNGQSGAR